MTCHVARRVGEFERRLRRDRREVSHALMSTDAELAELARLHRGDRLATGTFGTCEACARPIPFSRLRALPMGRLCMACEEWAERAARSPEGMTGSG
jgi:RNA polymerase-binding transcription factor DksA